jgi:hypothetical protein
VLSVNQSVEREIAAGTSHAYTIQLNTGEYVAGSIDQRGIAVLAVVFQPDGSRLLTFPRPREGKRAFAFIADAAGTYRLELRRRHRSSRLRTGTTSSEGHVRTQGH